MDIGRRLATKFLAVAASSVVDDNSFLRSPVQTFVVCYRAMQRLHVIQKEPSDHKTLDIFAAAVLLQSFMSA